MKQVKDFKTLNSQELEKVNGGFVLTGAAVAKGVAIFVGTFGVGYTIGNSR